LGQNKPETAYFDPAAPKPSDRRVTAAFMANAVNDPSGCGRTHRAARRAPSSSVTPAVAPAVLRALGWAVVGLGSWAVLLGAGYILWRLLAVPL